MYIERLQVIDEKNIKIAIHNTNSDGTPVNHKAIPNYQEVIISKKRAKRIASAWQGTPPIFGDTLRDKFFIFLYEACAPICQRGVDTMQAEVILTKNGLVFFDKAEKAYPLRVHKIRELLKASQFRYLEGLFNPSPFPVPIHEGGDLTDEQLATVKDKQEQGGYAVAYTLAWADHCGRRADRVPYHLDRALAPTNYQPQDELLKLAGFRYDTII